MVTSATSTGAYSAQAAQAAAAQATVQEDDGTVLSSDFETFIKMLTVQAQNQDPLNPVDSTEFATQLATFSSVEQQVLTNDLLRNLSANLSGNALNEASRWIGMEGLVRAPAMFSGNPISVRPEYAAGAESAQMVVRNSDGTEVARYDLAVGEENIVWGGYDSNGDAFPNGIYRFDIESYAGDSMLSSTMSEVYSRIDEVRNEDGTIMIQMSDGTEVSAEQINGLRAPTA